MVNSRKLSLYISMSLDGFIATEDDDISWLSKVEKEGEDYGYTAFTENVDTYIIGRKTYEVVKNLLGGAFPQAEKYKCYVITRENREPENGVTFYNGEIKDLIDELKSEPGGTIYCDGGGEIVKMLLDEELFDEYIISVIPVILGRGKRLFKGSAKMIDLTCLGCHRYDSGLVQLHYLRKE